MLDLGGLSGKSEDGGDELGIELLLQHWDELIADAVAGVVGFEIRVVGAKGLRQGGQIVEELVFSEGKEGAFEAEMWVELSGLRNAGEPGQSGTAHEVMEDCFDGIVGVVCRHDQSAVLCVGGLCQEVVAELSGERFRGGLLLPVGVLAETGEADVCGGGLNEELILEGIIAAE